MKSNFARRHKVDLLNANTDYDALRDWIAQETEFRRLTLAGIALVSSRRGFGMRDAVLQMITRARQGAAMCPVLGAANVGKSTVIRRRDGRASFGWQLFRAFEEITRGERMPRTTLGVIHSANIRRQRRALDTPGLFLHHRLNSLLGPEDLSTLRLGTAKKYVPETPDCAEPPGFASFQVLSVLGIVRAPGSCPVSSKRGIFRFTDPNRCVWRS